MSYESENPGLSVSELCDALITEYEATDNYQADQERWTLLCDNITLSNGRVAEIQVRVVTGADAQARQFMGEKL